MPSYQNPVVTALEFRIQRLEDSQSDIKSNVTETRVRVEALDEKMDEQTEKLDRILDDQNEKSDEQSRRFDHSLGEQGRKLDRVLEGQTEKLDRILEGLNLHGTRITVLESSEKQRKGVFKWLVGIGTTLVSAYFLAKLGLS